MLNAPNKNVELTFDQLQQLDVFQKRLTVLESNISAMTRDLNIVNKEVIKATKEREYQESLLADVSAKISTKQQEFNSLEASVLQVKESISLFQKEETEMRKTLTKKELELSERHESMLLAERKLTEQQQEFNTESQRQTEEREKLEIAYDAFSIALKTITWKSSRA